MRAALAFVAILVLASCGDDGPAPDAGPKPEGGPRREAGLDLAVDLPRLPEASPDVARPPDRAVDGPATDGVADKSLLPPDTGPVFGCFSVSPPAGNNGAAVTLTLEGYDLGTSPTVELVDAQTGTKTSLGAATATDTNADGKTDRAVVQVPAAQPQGLYEVRLTSGTQSASCGYYSSTTQPPPTVTDVVPDTAWAGDPKDNELSDQPVAIKGTGFAPVPAVRFISVATKQVYLAPTVSFLTPTDVTSVCPSESLVMPVGDYHVEVMNPSQLAAKWMKGGQPGIFKVTATPPPRIDDVAPIKVPANAGGGVPAVTVSILGDFFHQQSKLVLLLAAGAQKDLTPYIAGITVSPTVKDSITVTINNTVLALPVGIYPLRVINPDLQFDTFFSLQIENSAPGKLNADTWKEVSSLSVPRERHASVEGFDVFGGSFLYTVGGTTPAAAGLSTRPREVLSSTEITEADVFGIAASASSFALQLDAALDLATIDPKHKPIHVPSLLQTKRTGLTLVRAGRFLFAIGGADADTWDPAKKGQLAALKTVERAQILGYETMPNLSLPQVALTTVGLPKGAWYYRVSAVTPAGESLPSREVLALNAGGTLTLKWLPVTGATSYLVYRSLAADGRAGSTRLLKAGVTATSFSDDGQGALAPAPGHLSAKLASGGTLAAGTWSYRVSATVTGQSETLAGYPASVTTATGQGTVQLSWNPIPNATYNVYRIETTSGTVAYQLATGLTQTSFSDDGSKAVDKNKPAPVGNAPLSTGSLSRWETMTSQLTAAREGADAVVVKAVDGNQATTNEPSYIFVVGGRSDNKTNTDYLRTTERAQVDPATGTLGAFAIMKAPAGAEILLNTARGFYPLLTTQGRNEIPAPPPPPAPPCPDNDGDGLTACSCGGTDCNDADAKVFPGAKEICGDGKDQDCDQGCSGGADVPCTCTNPDADGDGFNSIACGGKDCNDNDAKICPDKTKCPEVCGDGKDQDCDGADLACPSCPDADGDGFQAKSCGGTDCNDNDAKICPDKVKCPDLTCDGIDQDCNGFDVLCLQQPPSGPQLRAPDPGVRVLALEDPRARAAALRARVCLPDYFPSWKHAAASGPEEAVHLVVLFGDASYVEPGNNQGLQTAEVAVVKTDGSLSAWTLQTEKVQGGTYRYGNEGLLYSDFAFSFQGVLNETLGADPPVTQIWNNVYRYELDVASVGKWTEPVPATLLKNLNPSDAPMVHGRVYQSLVRLNAYIYGIAGNVGINGTAPEGPTTSIERIKQ
jgi:hypothetical protein